MLVHMLRVVACSYLIIDNWNGPEIDKEAIIRVCLLHDMGNIVKIPEDFSKDENFIKTRRKYFEKYGKNDYEINLEIGKSEGLYFKRILRENGFEVNKSKIARNVILFDLPKETYTKYDNYESNGQSALLQEVKNILLERYPNTKMKGDGQVVVISFSKYKVELVLAFKQTDNRFKYPNSNNGGSWKYTDPLPEIEECKNLNELTTGNFYDVCHMLRAWKNKKGFKFKGLLIDTLIYNFFNENEEYKNVDVDGYLELIKSVFEFLKNEDSKKSYWLALGSNQQISNDDNGKFVKKAEKAYNKLINVKRDDKDINDILRGIFGREFPKKEKESKNLYEESIQYKNTEQFIEDKYIVDIQYNLELDCTVTQDGYRPARLSEMLKDRIFLKPRKQLKFYIKNISEFENLRPYNICWKVKNEGEVAKKRNMIRGQINITDIATQEEHTDFRGNHYLEAYIIKDGICIAKERIEVPIREMIED